MRNTAALSDAKLLSEIKCLVGQERELTLNVLHHLREVERRQLFARLGFSSLFEYTVRELGYSEGSAHRRVSSMRLLRALPEIEERIENGTLPLSTLAQAQSFFRQESITAPGAKIEILDKLEGKSAREVEKILVLESSEPRTFIKERVRPLSESLHHVSLTIDDELLKKIEELKALLSHSQPRMNVGDVLAFTVEECLKKLRVKSPRNFPAAPSDAQPNLSGDADSKIPAPEVTSTDGPQSSRHIPIEIRRQVWARDLGRCTYQDKNSSRRCESRHFLQFDHIQPFARGGQHALHNLRLRCSAHNLLGATEFFGQIKMQTFVPSLRQV